MVFLDLGCLSGILHLSFQLTALQYFQPTTDTNQIDIADRFRCIKNCGMLISELEFCISLTFVGEMFFVSCLTSAVFLGVATLRGPAGPFVSPGADEGDAAAPSE